MARSSSYNPQHYQKFQALEHSIRVYHDEDEWSSWNVIGDPVVHIEVSGDRRRRRRRRRWGL